MKYVLHDYPVVNVTISEQQLNIIIDKALREACQKYKDYKWFIAIDKSGDIWCYFHRPPQYYRGCWYNMYRRIPALRLQGIVVFSPGEEKFAHKYIVEIENKEEFLL